MLSVRNGSHRFGTCQKIWAYVLVAQTFAIFGLSSILDPSFPEISYAYLHIWPLRKILTSRSEIVTAWLQKRPLPKFLPHFLSVGHWNPPAGPPYFKNPFLPPHAIFPNMQKTQIFSQNSRIFPETLSKNSSHLPTIFIWSSKPKWSMLMSYKFGAYSFLLGG